MLHIAGDEFPQNGSSVAAQRIIAGDWEAQLEEILFPIFEELDQDLYQSSCIAGVDIFTAKNLPLPEMRHWDAQFRTAIKHAVEMHTGAFNDDLCRRMEDGQRLPIRFVFTWRIPPRWRGEVLALENGIINLFLDDMQWPRQQYAGRDTSAVEVDDGDEGFDLQVMVA